MDDDVLATAVRLNEAEAFLIIVEFHCAVPACMGGMFVKGLERLPRTSSLRPLGTRLSWGFAKAAAAIHGMVAPCLGRAQRSSPKARRVAQLLRSEGLTAAARAKQQSVSP
jgi:hypothetical protein